MASALCHGAGTIIAAFATGNGGAYGLDLWTKATVDLNESGKVNATINGQPKENTKLIELCVKNTLKYFKFRKGATVVTETNIPIAGGLKSSSVAANAVILATVGALAQMEGEVKKVRLSKIESRQEVYIKGKLVDSMDLIKIGVKTALEAKVSVTGAFDDASASYLGGYTVTDNRKKTILRKGDMETLNAIILVPKKKIYTSKADLKNIPLIKNGVDAAWNQALEGNVYTAITLNGMLHSLAFNLSNDPALEALKNGAVCAGLSGKGPSVIALTRGSTSKIKKAWKKFGGKIIECKTNNKPAYIIQ